MEEQEADFQIAACKLRPEQRLSSKSFTGTRMHQKAALVGVHENMLKCDGMESQDDKRKEPPELLLWWEQNDGIFSERSENVEKERLCCFLLL